MQQCCTIDLRAYGHGRIPQGMVGGLEGTPIRCFICKVIMQSKYALYSSQVPLEQSNSYSVSCQDKEPSVAVVWNREEDRALGE